MTLRQLGVEGLFRLYLDGFLELCAHKTQVMTTCWSTLGATTAMGFDFSFSSLSILCLQPLIPTLLLQEPTYYFLLFDFYVGLFTNSFPIPRAIRQKRLRPEAELVRSSHNWGFVLRSVRRPRYIVHSTPQPLTSPGWITKELRSNWACMAGDEWRHRKGSEEQREGAGENKGLDNPAWGCIAMVYHSVCWPACLPYSPVFVGVERSVGERENDVYEAKKSKLLSTYQTSLVGIGRRNERENKNLQLSVCVLNIDARFAWVEAPLAGVTIG